LDVIALKGMPVVQTGRKRGRGDVPIPGGESSSRGGDRTSLREQLGGSGSLYGSQDSLSLAGSQVQRALEPELERASTFSEDGTSESMNGRPRVGKAGGRGFPDTEISSTSSLIGKDGGRIRIALSFDGSRTAQPDGSAPGDEVAAPEEEQSTAQRAEHGGASSEGAVSPRGLADQAGAVQAEGPVSTSGKPADTARRKAAAGEGSLEEQSRTGSAVDGAVREHSVKDARNQSHAHVDSVSLPEGVDSRGAPPGKKLAHGKLVDVHASAEDQSSVGRGAAMAGDKDTGGPFA
jgi:hypothetical protein